MRAILLLTDDGVQHSPYN